jgi:phosphoglycerate dehydrogenase-like enzyme
VTLSIAVLDDYQKLSRDSADWTSLGDVALTVFDQHLGDDDAVAKALAGFDVIICMRERTRFPAQVIEQLSSTKLIVTAGMRNLAIDMEAARARGIDVCGTQMMGYPAAELAWALVMALFKRIPAEHQAMRDGLWQTTMAQGMNGKTFGLFGLGKLGQRVARMAQAFEMNVIAWSQNLTDEAAAKHGVERVEWEALLERSDVLCVQAVLSDRTRGKIGAAELARMKSSAYVVNTSRGPIVDEPALLAALGDGTIAGAGLDVFEVEPLPTDHPFRSLDNVVLTGHTGYVTDDLYTLVYGQAVDNIRGWQAGDTLRLLNGTGA